MSARMVFVTAMLLLVINFLTCVWVYNEAKYMSIYIIEEMGKVIVDHESRIGHMEKESYI
jgi:hypothetical protein